MTSFLTEVFRTVLNMSVTAAAVIAVLGLVRLPLKRAPKVITYGLWFVALFRLLCPVSFESAVSLFSLRRAPTMEFITNTADFPGIHPGQAALTPGSGAPVVPGPGAAPAAAGASDAGAALTLLNVLAFVWAAVAAGLIIYGIVSYILLKRRIGTATCAGGRVFESDRIAAPFVCGMLRPRIFLPVSLRESERAYITEHEKTHIRRRDYVIKPLWFLAVCLHWFNPLVWLAFLLMGRDMEMSCDEAVLRKMGEGVKADYSSSLLAFSSPRALFSASPLAFGESNILSRVKNVLSFKRPVVWVVIVAVAAAVTLTVALAANPKTAAAAAPADPVKTSAAPPTEVSAVSSADSGQAVSVDYVLYKLGKDGVVLTYISPLDENQKTTVENTLRKLYLASTYVPAVDPDSLDECYLIRVIPQGQTASNYYVFMNGGRACLQFGKNG
jgi:beta-lactamase regulating signal transducer with metallopeptidase domain